MSSVLRVNRKASDKDIIKYNSLGLSLATVGKQLGCHPTTITLRLQALNVAPADTRRAFMEDIILSLSPKYQDQLAAKLGPTVSIKDHIKKLVIEDLLKDI